MPSAPTALRIVISFAGFVALGLPSGILNVTWPAVRDTFGLSQDAVGALFIAHTTGYMLAGLINGWAISRFGPGRFLLISTLLAGLALGGYALAPAWWVIVCCGLAAGLGGGAVDAGMNTYFADNHSPTLMNWLHACFGLGAALGPQVAVIAGQLGGSWRSAYVVAAAMDGVLALAFALTAIGWRLSQDIQPAHASALRRGTATFALPAVWLNIGLFFLFTGLEATSGQWSYPLFTESRGVDPIAASGWISVYWASLTAGRIVFGIIVRWLGTSALLRASMALCILGSALLWSRVSDLASFVGLALLGFSIAPMFPLLISDTPRRVSAVHAANAIGFQVAAASVGIATLPGIAGALAARVGLETLGPMLFVSAVVLALLHELSLRVKKPSNDTARA